MEDVTWLWDAAHAQYTFATAVAVWAGILGAQVTNWCWRIFKGWAEWLWDRVTAW